MTKKNQMATSSTNCPFRFSRPRLRLSLFLFRFCRLLLSGLGTTRLIGCGLQLAGQGRLGEDRADHGSRPGASWGIEAA